MQDWQLCRLRPYGQGQFDWMRFLAFSGWGVVSLGLWAGIIEGVRLLFR